MSRNVKVYFLVESLGMRKVFYGQLPMEMINVVNEMVNHADQAVEGKLCENDFYIEYGIKPELVCSGNRVIIEEIA